MKSIDICICVLLACLGFCPQASGQGGIVTTVAGVGSAGFSGDGGPAASAALSFPSGIAADASGNIFIADSSNSRIRKVSPSGIITTFAGGRVSVGYGDGGPAASAFLSLPYGVAADGSGNLFIADTGDYRIRKVSANGIITTVAGSGNFGFSGDGGPAVSASLASPNGVAVDASGNLFIADNGNNRIRKVSVSGIITTVAGNGGAGFSGDGGPATAGALNGPTAVAVDAAGNLFIADFGNRRIRKVSAGGIITTFAGNGTFELGEEGDGGLASAAELSLPDGVVLDASGNLFIADLGDGRIRKVSATGIITTVAGDGSQGFSGDNGLAILAAFNGPYSVALDASGNLFIADSSNNRVRKVSAPASPDTIENLVFKGTATCTDSFCSKFGSGPITGAYSLDVTAQAIVGPWSFSAPFGVISSSDPGATAEVGIGGVVVPSFQVLTSTSLEFVKFDFPTSNLQQIGAILVDPGSDGCINIPAGEMGSIACDPDYVLTGTTTLAAAPGAPSISATNDASFATSISPGSLVALFGNGNVLANITASGFNTPLPTSSGGTSVTMNGILCPLIYVSPAQINLQAPMALPAGTATIVVNNNGTTFSTTVQVLAAAPGIFTSDYLVTAILQDGNGNLLTQNNPASPGQSVAMYLTGIGPVTNYPGDGEPAPFGPLAESTSSYALTVHGTAAHIDYVGLTPGFAGLGQINFEIPAGTPAGNTIPVVLTIAGTAAKTLQISVKAAAIAAEVQSLTLSPSSIASGGTVTGTVELSIAAPSGGAVVALSASSSGVSLPASVTVPAGSASAAFTFSAGMVSSSQVLTITASYGGTSAHASLTITPPVNAQCANVGGNWRVSESGSYTETIAATVETDTETDPISGSASTTITQTGCAIQYSPIGQSGLVGTNLTPSQAASLARTGTVSGNNVSVTGPLALVDTVASAAAGFTVNNISSNVVNASGQVVGNPPVMTLNETGMFVASGTYAISGQTGSFTETITTSSTAIFDQAFAANETGGIITALAGNGVPGFAGEGVRVGIRFTALSGSTVIRKVVLSFH